MTHAGPGMVNNPDLAFVKKVLAVAPKVAAMVNLCLKPPRKLIGLKRKKKEVLVVKHFITYCIINKLISLVSKAECISRGGGGGGRGLGSPE